MVLHSIRIRESLQTKELCLMVKHAHLALQAGQLHIKLPLCKCNAMVRIRLDLVISGEYRRQGFCLVYPLERL